MSDPAVQQRRARPLALASPLLVAAAAAGAWWAGLAGWRGGPALVTVGLVAVGAAAALVLGGRGRGAGAYVAGAVVVALVAAALAVQDPPLSHGRLAEVLDRLPDSFEATGEQRSGHGWCSPTCPTVTRTFAPEDVRASGQLERAVVAADAAGLVPRDRQRTFLTRALSIASRGRDVVVDHHRFTTTLRAVDPGDGRVALSVTVRSRRGFRRQPEPPRARAR